MPKTYDPQKAVLTYNEERVTGIESPCEFCAKALPANRTFHDKCICSLCIHTWGLFDSELDQD